MIISKKESGLNKINKTKVNINDCDYIDVLIEQVWDVDGKTYHTAGSWNHEEKNGNVIVTKHGMRGNSHTFKALNSLMIKMYEDAINV